MAGGNHERSPLLQNGGENGHTDNDAEVKWNPTCPIFICLIPAQIIDFSKEDKENPRNWTKARKFLNVAIIAFMASSCIEFQKLYNSLH